MSRSHQRTPIGGRTYAETDAPFKAREHRRERRAVKIAMRMEDELPDPRQFGGPEKSGKDGKVWFGGAPEAHRWMRK